MGCFDTVLADCPYCHSHRSVEFQSKGGHCRLDSYGSNNVPLDVAIGCFDGWCAECGEVSYAEISPNHVSVVAVGRRPSL